MSLPKSSKIALLFLSTFSLIFIASCFVFNQPRCVEPLIKFVVNRYSSTVKVQQVHIDQLQWSFFRSLFISNLHIDCTLKNETYKLKVTDFSLKGFNGLLLKKPIHLSIKDLDVDSKVITIWGANLDGDLSTNYFSYELLTAFVLIPKLKWKNYVVNNLKGDINDIKGRISFANLQGKFYSGEVILNGWYQYEKPLSYHVQSRLTGVDTALLSEINPAFEQLTAVISGDIQFEDADTKGISIQANLNAPLGGFMKASLLQFLARYIPQRQQIEDLVKHNQQIALNKAQIKIMSLSPEKISSNIKLLSTSINLDMNVKFDINIEGGLNNLLEYVN